MALTYAAGNLSEEGYVDPSTNSAGAGIAIMAANADNVGGSIGTIHSSGNWRADRQSPSKTHSNIQIQRNGVSGKKSTIGGVLVPFTLLDGVGSKFAKGEAGVKAANRSAELTTAIQAGLTASVNSWRHVKTKNAYNSFSFYKVEGTFTA